MRVNPEPMNIRDKNAILVEAHLDTSGLHTKRKNQKSDCSYKEQ